MESAPAVHPPSRGAKTRYLLQVTVKGPISWDQLLQLFSPQAIVPNSTLGTPRHRTRVRCARGVYNDAGLQLARKSSPGLLSLSLLRLEQPRGGSWATLIAKLMVLRRKGASMSSLLLLLHYTDSDVSP